MNYVCSVASILDIDLISILLFNENFSLLTYLYFFQKYSSYFPVFGWSNPKVKMGKKDLNSSQMSNYERPLSIWENITSHQKLKSQWDTTMYPPKTLKLKTSAAPTVSEDESKERLSLASQCEKPLWNLLEFSYTGGLVLLSTEVACHCSCFPSSQSMETN